MSDSIFCAFCGGHMEAHFPEPRCWKCGRTATFPWVQLPPPTVEQNIAAQQQRVAPFPPGLASPQESEAGK